MKKILTILVCTLACCLALTLAACGEHDFETGWSYDNDSHFHKCLKDGCTEVSDKAPHDLDKGTTIAEATYEKGETVRYACTVCKYYCDQTVGEPLSRTVVTSAEELAAALLNGENVLLADDIVLQDGANVVIDKALTLDGGGHKITARGNLAKDYRLVNIAASDCTVTVKNVDLEVVYAQGQSVQFLRGINFGSSENMIVNIENVSLLIPDYYALNIIRDNNRLTINVKDSTIQGWAAINNHASNVTFNATDSAFVGKNIHPSPDGTGNYFTTVISAGYIMTEKGDIFEEKTLSANNDFTFTDCTITALVNEVDGTPINTVQQLIDIRSPFNNKVTLTNCTLNPAGGHDKILSAYDSAYIPDENKNDTEFVIDTNKVFINGEDVTNDETLVEKYLDE
ncbi:MAG: hypothetical protein NC132_05235 [Corallococcus sp.]|nr:hypothetical protein [Corallococcus sp.]MCM1359941.1 hypothetical protein [Corallococcus sp.]MCM1395497.1 hypothetical protein [Corallococcus sp.]